MATKKTDKKKQKKDPSLGLAEDQKKLVQKVIVAATNGIPINLSPEEARNCLKKSDIFLKIQKVVGMFLKNPEISVDEAESLQVNNILNYDQVFLREGKKEEDNLKEKKEKQEIISFEDKKSSEIFGESDFKPENNGSSEEGDFGEERFGYDHFEMLMKESEESLNNNSEKILGEEEQNEWGFLSGREKEFLEVVFEREIRAGYIEVNFTDENGRITIDLSGIPFLKKPRGAKGIYNSIRVMLKGMIFQLIFNKHRELLPYVPLRRSGEDISNFLKELERIKSPRNAEEAPYVCWVGDHQALKYEIFNDNGLPKKRGAKTAEEKMVEDLFELFQAIKAAGMNFEDYTIEKFEKVRGFNSKLGADDFAMYLNYYTDNNGERTAGVGMGWFNGVFAIKPITIADNPDPRYLKQFKAYRVFVKENHHKLDIVCAS